jgi:uncharacterized membrane protein YtjA (UPF0391 family)
MRAWHGDCSFLDALSSKEGVMLYYAAVFFVIALVAAVLGFTGIAAGAAGIAKILFLIFLVLFAVSLVVGLIRRGA